MFTVREALKIEKKCDIFQGGHSISDKNKKCENFHTFFFYFDGFPK